MGKFLLLMVFLWFFGPVILGVLAGIVALSGPPAVSIQRNASSGQHCGFDNVIISEPTPHYVRKYDCWDN